MNWDGEAPSHSRYRRGKMNRVGGIKVNSKMPVKIYTESDEALYGTLKE